MANIGGNIKGLVKKVIPDSAHMVPKSESAVNLKALKKTADEKRSEQAKIYGFIGMEVYDLVKEKKIEIPQIQNYFKQMDALSQEILDLEEKIKEQEIRNLGKNVCACGYKLKADDRFCPNCGEPVPGIVVCSCGLCLDKDTKFCSSCGKKMEDILKEQETQRQSQVPMRECVCGAKIPAGQFMCFECGRKIES